ncbi:MAG: hypothetical protein ACYC61_04535 [Isosphaeraceae bacterium]
MFPRIILVGIVAALGITLPTRPEMLGWVHAVHNWTTGLRAMMDGGRPFASEMETEAGTVAGWPLEASAYETAFAVAPAAKESAVPTPSPMWTPIRVEEQVSGLAHELNRRSEGLDLQVLPPAPRHAAVATNSRRGKDAGLERIVRTLLDRDLIDELARIGRDGASDGPEVAVVDPVRRARSAGMVLECTLGHVPSSPRSPRGIVAVPEVRPATPARIEPIAPVEEKELGLAFALNRFGEAVDPAHPATWMSVVASAPARIVPVEAPDTGLAHELNRAAEGLAQRAIGPAGDEPAGREVGVPRAPAARAPIGVGQANAEQTPSVGNAVRLTREAARAWMDVLRTTGGGESAVRVSAR